MRISAAMSCGRSKVTAMRCAKELSRPPSMGFVERPCPHVISKEWAHEGHTGVHSLHPPLNVGLPACIADRLSGGAAGARYVGWEGDTAHDAGTGFGVCTPGTQRDAEGISK